MLQSCSAAGGSSGKAAATCFNGLSSNPANSSLFLFLSGMKVAILLSSPSELKACSFRPQVRVPSSISELQHQQLPGVERVEQLDRLLGHLRRRDSNPNPEMRSSGRNNRVGIILSGRKSAHRKMQREQMSS